MRGFGSGFLGALQFLTRVPVRTKQAAEHARVVPWFGVVGCLIGAAVGALAALLSHLLVPSFVTAACAITFGLLLTGAFHEDGLADTADAFGGGCDRERRLEIMKDSRHGTYGVAALAASIVIRVAAVASVASVAATSSGNSVLFRSLVVAHGVGRAGAMAVMLVVPPAASTGLGYEHGRQLHKPAMVLGLAAVVAVCWLLLGTWVWLVVAVVAIGAALTAVLAVRKIGGVVGDVLGAVEQVGECLALVVMSGLVARSWIA